MATPQSLRKLITSLRTGACLDDPQVALPTFPIRRDPATGRVEVEWP
ncbi:hypothetical protein [Actinomadura miaoliensis]